MKLNIRTLTGRSFIIVSTLTLLLVPSTSFAVESADGCTAPVSTESGVRRPTGADAATYQYNCTTNLWENAHFTYNPATQQTLPKDTPVYIYNDATGLYDYTVWHYSPAQGAFYQATESTAQPPAGAQKSGGPKPVVATPASPSLNSDASATVTPNAAADKTTTTGSGSGSTTNLTGASNTTLNNNTNASLNNTISANGSSGNALVLQNTQGGDALTGSVTADATVVNMLQSSSNMLGAGNNVKTFNYDINGDVYGDLFFDPTQLSKVQNASSTTDLSNDLTINNSTDAAINNDINLTSKSGDATVSENTDGGNATTGNAQAVANVINLINTAITSGDSFIGTININGNLNGDILMPPDFINQLIASNVPTVNITVPDSTNTNNTTVSDTTKINNTNNLGINNNVNTTASSGNATVSENTLGGSASTGKATTNVTAFNLTGSNTIGKNSLLVFVNVLGKWVGLIVNAPAGATAAELGGDTTTNTTLTNNANINNTTNEQINNNINVDSQSGNAEVSRNTKGGNATTGNAKSGVNLANLEGNNLSLSDWFGILFINVFGSWNGSFGVDTAAGNPPVSPSAPATGGLGSGTSSTAASISSPIQVFRFAAAEAASIGGSGSSTAGTGSGDTQINLDDYQQVLNTANNSGHGSVLAAATTNTPAKNTQSARNTSNLWRSASIIGGLVILFIIADAVHSRRKQV